MKITTSKLKTLLTIGENLNIEFKRAADGPKADTFESVCAFLNKAGGDLLLGVDDDGTVVGLPPKAVDAMIRNHYQVQLADELGSGVRNLYHYVKIYSNAEPIFDEDDVFRLIVPLDDAYSADRALTKTAQEAAQENLSDIELKILSCIKMDSEITRKLISEKIGISTDSVKRRLDSLKAKVGLRHEGPTKKGHWVFDK